MNVVSDTVVSERNQQCLVDELARVRRFLEAHARRAAGEAPTDGATSGEPARDGFDTLDGAPSALSQLVRVFGLSAFERDILLMCAGIELDGSFPSLCGEARGDARLDFPTFGLALAALPDPHWDALSPGAALRFWRLVEVDSGPSLVASRLRVDERVLHFLTNVRCLDPRLEGTLRPIGPDLALPPSQQSVAGALASVLGARGRNVMVVLDGEDVSARAAAAGRAAEELGCDLLALRAADLPQHAGERIAMARLVDREAAFLTAILLIECESPEEGRTGTTFAQELRCPVIVAGGASAPGPRAQVHLSVDLPDAAEQRDLWRLGLEGLDESLLSSVEDASAHFRFGTVEIHGITEELRATPSDRHDPATHLRQICLGRARSALDELAQRIKPQADWDCLVLPPAQLRLLRDMARQVRHRVQVYEQWGFAEKTARGLGISALFAGESGTGKTLAAEVLAVNLGLDLYRIDLSAVVSKYIGETEKSLRRVFDAAEASGAVLLFDEADALFGKRSEVRDSHDRYANLEIAYLLQRMDAYRGLAILTSNMRGSLDQAFLRRIRFIIQFPFPGEALRAEIWRRMFPEASPVDGVDFARLARLQIPGGCIRNIAVGAAFLAADAGGPLTMEHLMQAARTEYAKIERPFPDCAIKGRS